ncbi:DNA mismatch repair protein MutT [bacterium (Candidatus Gribaldobacteria) CG07_land_8_20_14_0_80_33_18]|uniref:DNA mismatch repair protein MutT n=1 Tax=bacterium (Candidatus Gribaldobacteria) CG07_land_8_20_14_0_80_33_18 TaxID=2014272 RepID=A0A2M6Z3F0_9BACT|nr:MAG: DNA mismatch repair protein MutT [bacterium (Candidatus Gribaldobacteria) CG10_big_fil_rev_8_21_14_0_10_33_41]PIU46933.1 MAG: DNA mismatch repair protein MutT [bacterium (Candidatus Gribaldobacteria) CG07_land_8_20_14_0_80_33_18]PJA00999.1 MAG: DNA mismatch repair protein MutT [bacterium (Candidatus Gribaldobacteria) CG_4_10_14_0_2_um_filter_33_15]PJB08629.1 MAG: DNA mismatch repair protein MutT [bacterium (Candidatus Gribaldobacteria) CG_4_9_14_3_um_filter_33_9]
MNKRVVGVIIRNGEILLMRRVRDDREYFVFPGGGIKRDESLENGVIREIKEEFNLDVKINKFLFQIENRGRQEFYFLIKEFSGVPEISGNEKKRMNKNNQYYPVWKELKEISNLSNLHPEKAKQKVKEMILD